MFDFSVIEMSFVVLLFAFLLSGVFAEAPSYVGDEQFSDRSMLTSDDLYGLDEGSGSNADPEGRSIVDLDYGECILQQKQIDVVFLIDMGEQVGPDSSDFFKEYIMSVLRLFDIEDLNTRVALVSYGSSDPNGMVILELADGNSHLTIQFKLQNLKKGYYPFRLPNGLRKAGEIFTNSPSNSPKVVIIITCTPLLNDQELGEVLTAGTDLGNDVTIYLVAVGTASSDTVLAKLAFRHNSFHAYYKTAHDYGIVDLSDAIKDSLKKLYQCDQCIPNPCTKMERCTVVSGARKCVCNLGYMDGRCSDTDPCRAAPCPSGTKCLREGFGFTCVPFDEDQCLGFVCSNGGRCFLQPGGPTCQCLTGYVGDSCQARCPLCPSNKFCVYENQRAICKCQSGTGPNCTPVPSPCSVVRCINGGQCVISSIGFAHCQCPSGYLGTVCEISPCRNHPCRNGGTCVVSSSRRPYCVCAQNFEGIHCDHTPGCITKVCRNGGHCIVQNGVAVCECLPMYFGTDCGESRCDRRHFRCYNGGVCELTNGNLPTRCRCPPQWNGVTCQIPTCFGWCQNGGACRIDAGRPLCSCYNGFTGDRCQYRPTTTTLPPPNPCVAYVCFNGGVCVIVGLLQQPSCNCPSHYTGLRCETPVCVPPCLNGGTCVKSPTGGNVCKCPFGLHGRRCEFNPCSIGYCLNGGTCITRHLADTVVPECICPSPFTGTRCESSSDDPNFPCKPNPCQAPCVCLPSSKHDQGFVCESNQGLLGKHCDIPKPNLICRHNSISVSVSHDLFKEFGGDRVMDAFFYLGPDENYKAPEKCKATVAGGATLMHTLSISGPFDDCGTTSQSNPSGDVIVRNRIWFNIGPGVSQGLYDMPIPVLQFECIYGTDYTVSTSIKPVVDKLDKSLSAAYAKRFSGNFTLCKEVVTCLDTCPPNMVVQPGNNYTVGQYIGIVVSPDQSTALPGQRLSVHRLFMSCADGLMSVPVVNVIDNGCPPNVLPTTVKQHTSSICIYFQIPRVEGCEVVFFHAHMLVCDETSLEYCSNTGLRSKCPNPTNRKRREAIDLDQEDVVGPIFLNDPPADQIDFLRIPELPFEFEIHSNKDTKDDLQTLITTKRSDLKSRDLFIILGSLALVVVTLSAFVSIRFYHSYRRNGRP